MRYLYAYQASRLVRLLVARTALKIAIEPNDFIASDDGGLFTVKTFGSWTVVGPLRLSQEQIQANCHSVMLEEYHRVAEPPKGSAGIYPTMAFIIPN